MLLIQITSVIVGKNNKKHFKKGRPHKKLSFNREIIIINFHKFPNFTTNLHIIQRKELTMNTKKILFQLLLFIKLDYSK